jgi:hypothetical protein
MNPSLPVRLIVDLLMIAVGVWMISVRPRARDANAPENPEAAREYHAGKFKAQRGAGFFLVAFGILQLALDVFGLRYS